MRPSFTVSLLLLSLLFFEQVQGIRLEKGFHMSVGQHKSIHMEEITLTKTNNVRVTEDGVVCKDAHYSGNNRKLFSVTPSTTTTTTISKNEKNAKNKADPISNGGRGTSTPNRSQQNGGAEEKSSTGTVNSLSISEEHPNDQYKHYPDVVDLAEMDYSPARRKTPIHN